MQEILKIILKNFRNEAAGMKFVCNFASKETHNV